MWPTYPDGPRRALPDGVRDPGAG